MTSAAVIAGGRLAAGVMVSGRKWRRLASSLWHPLGIKPRDVGSPRQFR